MKQLNIMRAIACATTLLCVPAKAQLFPLKLVDKTKSAANNVQHSYVIFTCQDYTAAANPCVLQLKYDSTRKGQVGTLVRVNGSTDSRKYTYALDSLQGYDSGTKSVKVYIPELQSGRCMVSLNYPLQMPPVKSDSGSYNLQAPSITDTTDPNYQIIFDKFEFTFNQNGTLYIDPTAVDFFSIPISLKDKWGSKSGPNDKTANRDSIITTIKRTFDSSNDPQSWNRLVINYPGKKSSTIRIAAPSDAPYFNPNYLTASNYSYFDSLVAYYKKNTLVVNAYILNAAGQQVYDAYKKTPKQCSSCYKFYGKINSNNQWIFKNKPTGKDSAKVLADTIDMNALRANSWEFFGPGQPPLATPDGRLLSIISEDITAAFTVGLLPAPNNMSLDTNYLQRPKKYKYYARNKYLKNDSGTGPWYNLYTKGVHKAIPEIYAFAFDDVLGQSGTIRIHDTTYSDTVTVTLGNLGSLQIQQPPVSRVLACSLTYNSGFQPVMVGRKKFYADTLKWKVPTGQPKNAGYFFILSGGGAPYTMTVDSGIYYQYFYNHKQFYKSTDSTGVMLVPSDLGSGFPQGIAMQVGTCGGPGLPCNINALLATDSAIMIAPTSNVVIPAAYDCNGSLLPVTAIYSSGFLKRDSFYVDSMSWTVPAGQSTCAKYLMLPAGPGSGFSHPLSHYVPYSGHDQHTSHDTMSMKFIIPKRQWGTTNTDSVYMQVYTYGRPDCSLEKLLSSNFNCAPTIAPVRPSAGKKKKSASKREAADKGRKRD